MGFVSDTKDKLKFKIALLKNEMDPMSLLFLVVVVIFFSAFLILPLLSIIAAAFNVNDELLLNPIFGSMSALITYNFNNSALYYYFGAFLTFVTIHSYYSVNNANQRIYSHLNINRNPRSPKAILGVLLSVRALLIALFWYVFSLMATSADKTSIYSLISGIIMAILIMVIFYFWNNSRETDQKVIGISIKNILKYQIFMIIFYIIVQLGFLMIEKSYYNNIIGDTEILVIATNMTSFLTIILTVFLLLILHLFRKRKQLSNENFKKLLKSSFDHIFTRLLLILFLILPFMVLSQDNFMKWFNDWIIKTDGKTLFDLLPITFFGSIFDALNTLSFDFFIQVFTNQNATYLEMDQNAIFSLLGFVLVFLLYRSYRSNIMQEDNVIKAYFEMNHVKRSIISTIYLSALILFLAVIDIFLTDLIPIDVNFGILYLVAVILLAMAYESKIINIEGTLGYFYLPLSCIFTLITITIVYALSDAIQTGFPIAAQTVIDQGADPSTVIIYKTLDSYLIGIIIGFGFILTIMLIGLIISRFKNVKFEDILSVEQFASYIEFMLLSIILVFLFWFGSTFLGQAYPVIQWGNGVIPFEIYLFIAITIIFVAITIAKRLISPSSTSSKKLLYITIPVLIGILGIVYFESRGYFSILTGGNRIINSSLVNVLNMMIGGLLVIYIVFSAIKLLVDKYTDDNLRIYHLLRLVCITLIGILFSTALALHWGFFNGLLVALVFLIQAILQGSDLPVETRKELSIPLIKSKIKSDNSIINFIKIIIALIITLAATYTIEFLADDLFQSLAEGKIVFLSKYTFSSLDIPFIGNISLNLITLALFVSFILLIVQQIVSARSQGSLGNGTQLTIILSKIIILTVITAPFIIVNLNEFLNWDIQFVRISADQSELVLSGLSSSTLVSTLFVGLGTTLVSTIIGVALAFIIARYNFSGKNLLRVLILFPLVIPPFVGAIGARRILLDLNSSLNLWLSQQLEIIPWAITFKGLLAVILVQSIHFYTLVYLNSLSSFLNIDPSLEESAENLGSGGFHLFRTITLPLATPGIAAGAVLTFILSVEDLGTPLIFYGDEQIKELLTFKVWDNLQGLTGNISGPILALGVILLIIAMSGFAVIRKYVSLREYSMISKGGTFSDRSRAISKGATLLIWSLTLILLGFALIPHIGTILLSIHNPTQGVWSSTRDVIPKVITFEFLFSSFGDTIRSLIFPTGWLISFIALFLVFYLNKNYIKKKVISTWNSILFGLTIPILVILFSLDNNLKGIFPKEFYISTGETITGILSGIGDFFGDIKQSLTDFGSNYLDLIFIISIIISLILIILLFKTSLKKFKTLTLDEKSVFIAQLLIASVLIIITIFAAYDNDVLLNLVFAIILIFIGYLFSKKYFESFWNKFAALSVFILMGSIGLWYDIFDFVEINLPYYDVSSAYEETILRTMILSFVAIIAIVILGVAAAYILARKKFPGKGLLDTLVTSPIALPGVVIGLGYMSFFVKITSASIMVEGFSFEPFFGFGLFYLIHFALIISFTIRRFPFTVRSAYAGLLQTHETFEEVSKNLGASQTETLKRVTLPLIAANIFGGAMISFVYALGEVSTSMILLGTEGQATIPWLIRSLYNTGFSYVHYAAALGMILLVLQLIVITVSNSILKRTGSAVTGI